MIQPLPLHRQNILDRNLSAYQKAVEDIVISFVDAVKNPYLFRVGSIGVHVTYSGNTGDTLQRRIHNLLISEN